MVNMTRMIVLTVMMNIIVSIATTMYYAPIEVGTVDTVYGRIGGIETSITEKYDPDELYSTTPELQDIQEGTVLNQMKMSRVILDSMINFFPIGLTINMASKGEAIYIVYLIDMFRTIFHAVLFIMLYHFFKNKGSNA